RRPEVVDSVTIGSRCEHTSAEGTHPALLCQATNRCTLNRHHNIGRVSPEPRGGLRAADCKPLPRSPSEVYIIIHPWRRIHEAARFRRSSAGYGQLQRGAWRLGVKSAAAVSAE